MIDVLPALPRELENAAEGARIHAWLVQARRPLWPGATVSAPRVAATAALQGAIATAQRDAHVTIGLEAAAAVLDQEARGLAIADRRAGSPRETRVSRLLVLANDGAVRFYREAERIAQRHATRLLVCVVEAPAIEIGSAVLGRPGRVKALLVRHKHAVAAVLQALGGAGG